MQCPSCPHPDADYLLANEKTATRNTDQSEARITTVILLTSTPFQNACSQGMKINEALKQNNSNCRCNNHNTYTCTIIVFFEKIEGSLTANSTKKGKPNFWDDL